MSQAADQIEPWHQTNWDARAAANFVGGGSGSGLLIAAAVAAAAGAPYRPLAFAALVLVAAGLACVWFEIGRPWRALNVFLHPRTSWMTREALVAVPLFVAGTAALWQAGGAYAWVTAALAASFLWCQAQILRAAKGIPAWREPRVVPLIFATGLVEGTGLLAIACALPAPPHDLARPAAAVLAGLAVVRGIAWRAYRARLEAPKRSLAALDGAAPVFHHAGNWVAAFLAAVAALVAPGAVAAPLGAIAGAIAAAAGWHLKFVLVARAGFNQGFALPRLPVRGSGTPGRAAKPGWGPPAAALNAHQRGRGSRP
jgi:phenylacetyl-CoA:acceptor oxidoreductase subunit 2